MRTGFEIMFRVTVKTRLAEVDTEATTHFLCVYIFLFLINTL